MAESFFVRKSLRAPSCSAPEESSASRGAKRPSSLRIWETASLSKAAQQNSPVEISQKAAAPRPLFRYTEQI